MKNKEVLKNKENLPEEDVEKKGWLTKEVLNFKEASVLLGISSSMLYKLTHQRAIPYYKPNGKLIYFKKTDLMNWMLSKRVSSVEEVQSELFNQLELRKCS